MNDWERVVYAAQERLEPGLFGLDLPLEGSSYFFLQQGDARWTKSNARLSERPATGQHQVPSEVVHLGWTVQGRGLK